ncbi:MAG: PilT/PilU family type 4a pilus ATPase [Alphaproteobacteria bacterium]|nr:PilT/PilU family type 4a pilus ATPase [Alphaproteobacteria bacterium]
MASSHLTPLLDAMVARQASDVYVTVGSPASLRIGDRIEPVGDVLDEDIIRTMIREVLSDSQMEEFNRTHEFNTSLSRPGLGRFRLNCFVQRHSSGMVLRRINTVIPTPEELKLPKIFTDLIMEKRGLLLVVGGTGSGKSTSLAAMLGHRNAQSSGHILTVEDPVEFVHEHRKCIITQREVGIDTESYAVALKNALRQRPDVVLIGEIRDLEVLEHAINFAESGHLCVATLHANNANQTIQRIINLFPEDRQKQILHNLSLNLIGVISQRLVSAKDGGRALAVEIMLNEGLITQLIEEGNVKDIKDTMAKSRGQGMQTFDQALLDLFAAGVITQDTAEAESDNAANLRLMIKQYQSSPEAKSAAPVALGMKPSSHLNMMLPEVKPQK